jgi:formate-dependent nitrite reductase membrane component NrfD
MWFTPLRLEWLVHGECLYHEKDGWMALLLSFFADCMVTVRLTHILHLLLLNLFSSRWFAPDEASGFCSQAVTDSSMRASTYSLGSICLGSLLTALLQVAYHLVVNARQHSRGNTLVLCIVECLVDFLERM